MQSEFEQGNVGKSSEGDAPTHEHSHDHSGEHSHEHDHTTDAEQMHTHSHAHEHSRNHTHGASDRPSAAVLLNYMLDHNRHHAEELEDIARSLKASGQNEAASAAQKALELYRKGNNALSQAAELSRSAEQVRSVDPSKSTELAKVVEIAKATELARVVEHTPAPQTSAQKPPADLSSHEHQ